jgi:hypothetical protein
MGLVAGHPLGVLSLRLHAIIFYKKNSTSANPKFINGSTIPKYYENNTMLPSGWAVRV